jgi:hypothetical protein
VKIGSISHVSIRHFESFECCFQLSFLRISFSFLEPIGRSVGGSYIVSTWIQVSRPFTTPSTPSQTQSSCDWGVKGVGNQIVWYFRDHSQTNHKLTGTVYICVMYVRRESNYVCLNELTKMCEDWVNQSRINQTFRVF